MPTFEKQVRVFVSSTFRDMHAERDHLVTVVFPELRERVEQLGLEFFDVDLRWGVPETGVDGEKANSWEYCRWWIDRVEPFFVCMLGQHSDHRSWSHDGTGSARLGKPELAQTTRRGREFASRRGTGYE